MSAQEWDFFLASEKAGVFGYFHDKYGAQDMPGFWSRDFHGEKPQALLESRARKSLGRIKAEQRLAHQAGLLPDMGWGAFLEDLDKENRRRALALEEGKPVYGPVRMDKRAYYFYRQSNLVLALKRAMAAQGLAPQPLLDSAFERRVDSLSADR